MNKLHASLFGEIKSVVDSDNDWEDILRFVCQMLRDGVEHFDWVGIYRYDTVSRTLILGPYAGQGNGTYGDTVWKGRMRAGGRFRGALGSA